MHAFCLFCETQRCRDIAAFVEKTMGLRCLSPRVIQRKWIRGVPQEIYHDWLPGYLFLYTPDSVFPRPEISGIIRVLGGGELTGSDLAFAEMLDQRDGVLGNVRLAREGDKCRIADPLWENLQGTLLKVDRGRKRCCVVYEFDRRKREIWVGYDLVRAVDMDDGAALCPQKSTMTNATEAYEPTKG